MAEVVTDDRGQALPSRRPSRIVSLVPSITETLFALGAGDRVVAVTRFCTHPTDAVAKLPKVGGTKSADCERILSLAPDLVFMSEEENRIADYERLTAAGCAVFVSFPRTVEAVADWVARVGQAVGVEAAALALEGEIRRAHDRLRSRFDTSRRVAVFCPVWRAPWISFNADTYCHDILWSAGAANVCAADADRYGRVELDVVAARQPEAVLLPDEPYPFGPRDLPELECLWRDDPGLPVRFVDGRALSWYGARTPAALRELARIVTGLKARKS